MFDFLNEFWDFFFWPLYQFDYENDIYVLIYIVIVALVIVQFVRKVLECFLSF